MSENNRIKYVDICKGIGIMLVLFGHSLTLMDNSVNRFILSFHMPLFFFISGITFSNNYSLVRMIKREMTLVIPIITGAVLSFFGEILCDVILMNKKNIIDINFWNKLDNWFLITLILSQLIVFVIRIFKIKLLNYFALIISLILFFMLNMGDIPYFKYIEKTCCAVVFMLIGKEIGTYSISVIKRKTDNWFINPIVILFILVAILSSINVPIGMANNTYGNKFLFLTTAILGTYMTLLLSNYLCGSRFLEFCGRNSIYIFITHFSVQKILITLWGIKGLPTYYTYPYFLIIFVLLVTFDIPIVYLFSRYASFLFGK